MESGFLRTRCSRGSRVSLLIPTLAVVLVVGVPHRSSAADAGEPHPHQGVVPHFDGAPPRVKLTREEKIQLRNGQPVRKQIDRGDTGRGVAVFTVNAPPSVVWSVISDFASYPKWIDSLKETEVYKKDGDNIFVRFKISTWAMDIEYFIKHIYPMEKKGWGTWTLDYSRKSDLDDSVGYWRVNVLDGNPDRCQVEYSVDLAISGWVPGFVKNIIVDKGLDEATSWVKIQAEKRFKDQKLVKNK